MIFGSVLLCCCIIGGSFIGPASNLLETENSWVKVQWAYYLRLIYCFPMLIIEILMTKDYLAKVKKAMTLKISLGVLLSPFLQLCHTYGMMYGSINLI